MSLPTSELAYDAIVVGAGFGGMYQLLKLRELGLSAVALERGPEVGGTWYWNRYPGARCDITSLDYSYSFDEDLQQEWEWSEKFATQPEILSYAQHVAERFDLKRDIRFQHSVESATWDQDRGQWCLDIVATNESGVPLAEAPTQLARATFLIFAVGNLSAAHTPPIQGLQSFEGRVLHTAEWPKERVDFSGRKVGVIGTGSSGIQLIPIVAAEAEELHIFHRTPNYSLPANNRPLEEIEVRERKAEYAEYRQRARYSFTGVPVPVATQSVFDVSAEEREQTFEAAWESGRYGALLAAYTDLAVDAAANELAAEFIRNKVRAVVHDPSIAAVVEPRGNPFGTKRSCLDSGYYETLNNDNVRLHDLLTHPELVVAPTGVETSAGIHRLDDLILATGFDAMTGSILAIDPVGENGRSLSEAWTAGPYTYLGIASAGFPNLFFITGPGSPSVLSNMIVSIEQHVEWITDLISHARFNGLKTVQPREAAQVEWMQTVRDEADATLYMTGNSWYLGANIPGKPRVFMPYVAGVGKYRSIAEAEAAAGYPGFLQH